MSALLERLRSLRIPAVQLAFLERPRDLRDALARLAVIAAVIAAAVAPVFLGRGGSDVSEGASASFLAQQAELEEVQAQYEALEEAGDAQSDDGRALAARISELEAATMLGHIEREGDSTRVGERTPDFRLLTLEGEPFQLSAVEGPVILNFWASWCAPCIEEMPDFELVHQEFGDRLTLIGVNDGEDLETALEFQGRTGVTYVVLLDPTTQLTRGPYGLIGRPTTFYIKAGGIIHDIRVGIHSLEEMRRLAGELLGEQPTAAQADAPASAGYAESALDLIASGRANFNVGADLLDDWAENPSRFDDPGWRRNIVAQTRVWDALAERAEGLTAPRNARQMHDQLAASLASIQVSGALIREAVESDDASEIEAAGQLLATGADEFRRAASELEASLR